MKSQHKYFHGKTELLTAQSDLEDPKVIEAGIEMRQRLIVKMGSEEARLITKRVLEEQVRLAKIQLNKSWRRSNG